MTLDDAIDHVASRMTHVEEDAALSARIAAALPEQRRAPWWILAFAPALAAIVLVVVLRPFSGGSAKVLPTENGITPMVALAASVERSSVEPPQIDRRTFVERSSNIRRTTRVPDRPDHEFALPPIPAVAALNVDTLIPASLPEDERLTVAPLTVEPLALDPVQR